MGKEELYSALEFLHSTGSVLHYGSGTQDLSWEVQETVLSGSYIYCFILFRSILFDNSTSYQIRKSCLEFVRTS